VIFWDTSAVVPLLVNEPESARVTELARRDNNFVVWWATPVECASALARQEREGRLTSSDADAARELLAALRSAWIEILASSEVRERAETLLLRHALRAGDALQLAAALTWARGAPRSHAFACLDDRLRLAARGEGFQPAL
jgi:predicted nucleic acid-binding protein